MWKTKFDRQIAYTKRQVHKNAKADNVCPRCLCFIFDQVGPDFSFHSILRPFKDFFDRDSNVLVENGSKVSQGLVFPREYYVPGFEFISLRPRAGEEKNAFLFALSPSPEFPSFPKK